MEEDLTAKKCLSVDMRYADLVNGLLLGGEQVLNAADLQELDSQQWNRPERRKSRHRQSYRDFRNEQGIEQGMFRIVYKKIKKNYTLDMIADDLEEEIEVIRPLYERALKELEEKKSSFLFIGVNRQKYTKKNNKFRLFF